MLYVTTELNSDYNKVIYVITIANGLISCFIEKLIIKHKDKRPEGTTGVSKKFFGGDMDKSLPPFFCIQSFHYVFSKFQEDPWKELKNKKPTFQQTIVHDTLPFIIFRNIISQKNIITKHQNSKIIRTLEVISHDWICLLQQTVADFPTRPQSTDWHH